MPGPQGEPAPIFTITIQDLKGTACMKGATSGTVQTNVDPTTGQIIVVCITPAGTGGGGGAQTNTTSGDCKWDNGTPNDADVPPTYETAGVINTGTCTNGVPGYVSQPILGTG